MTFKYGKLTDHQKLGEALMYAMALFTGIFTFFCIPKNMIKDNILPDE
jgi:hypothetical protein